MRKFNKDKAIALFYLALFVICVVLGIICLVLRIYVVIHFANTPIVEIPAWAYVFMSE